MANNILVTITMDSESNDAVIEMSEQESVSKAEIIRRAVKEYLTRNGYIEGGNAHV